MELGLEPSPTQKKNAKRRAAAKASTIGVFCKNKHPLQRVTPMEALTKYGVDVNAGEDITVDYSNCFKCKNNQGSFEQRIADLYRPGNTYVTLRDVVYAVRNDDVMQVFKETCAGEVHSVEPGENGSFELTISIRAGPDARHWYPVPEEYVDQMPEFCLPLIITDRVNRAVRVTLHDGVEVHTNVIIGAKCGRKCKPECEWHKFVEAEHCFDYNISFAQRVAHKYRPGATAVTVHDVVFYNPTKSVFSGSFHGKVASVEPGIAGSFLITVNLYQSNACEPVPDVIAKVLPPKFSRLIMLDNIRRAVRIVLPFDQLETDSFKCGSACNDKCDPTECKKHDLRSGVKLK